MANNSASLLPGANPTGLPAYGGDGGAQGFVPGAGTSSGANPMLLPPNLPASAPISNPYDTSVVPTFGANSGAYTPGNLLGSTTPGKTNVSTAAASPIGGMNLMSPTDLSRMYSSLKKTYGDGTAHAILDFLTTGAGFNQDAINNLFASLQPGIERGTESLMNQFSATGNRFGSGAEIGLGDYLSQVQLNEGEIETQMYEQSINDYMNTLLGVGSKVAQTKANSPSLLDTISGALGVGSSAAGGVSSLISAFNPTADTSILDTIASLGAL